MRRNVVFGLTLCGTLLSGSFGIAGNPAPKSLTLHQRLRVEIKSGSGRYRTVRRTVTWKPQQTAIVVCDMWDLHHCLNATRRGREMASRMNRVLAAARRQGMLIIHAPSGCVDAYKGHPARLRALDAPRAKNLPKKIGSWCYRIPAEEQGLYPIDQTDGGEDDDPDEHRQWAATLKSMGRNPRHPWKKQTSALTIDEDRDVISDNGEEIWSVMEQRNITNVILLGVHANMCVLGRPFGLRQMAKNGKHVVLMRDMTDTMYNPRRAPYVSHFTGTDLIVEHIEKYVCPTITSVDFLGGRPFRFRNDRRPHLVIVSAEQEYQTEQTLPKFALKHLGKAFRVSYVFADEADRNNLPEINILNHADLVLISVRRRLLPKTQLDVIRRFVMSGKPVIGLRTASHAFAPSRGKQPAAGQAMWVEFDHEVLGGNYHNHYGNQFRPVITAASGVEQTLLPTAANLSGFHAGGSLYRVQPLSKSTTVLLTGRIEGHPPEPVAWTNITRWGGRVFYTSLGHPDDFKSTAFNRFLANAVYWAAGLHRTTTVAKANRSLK